MARRQPLWLWHSQRFVRLLKLLLQLQCLLLQQLLPRPYRSCRCCRHLLLVQRQGRRRCFCLMRRRN